ncbi:MAG: hypothetical protein KC713_04105, partial [Candidatus Omnitrophica bacterium]|nr:hypothetical protein [Candidatus Omnitrophota bacterium]
YPRLILGSYYETGNYPIPNDMLDEMMETVDILINTKTYQRADRLLDALLQGDDFPRDYYPSLKNKQLLLELKNGRKESARQHLAEYLKLFNRPEEFIGLAVLLDQHGLSEEVLYILDEGSLQFLMDPDILLLKGIVLGNANRFDEAEEVWKKGVKIFPMDSRFITYLDELQRVKNNQ